MFFVFSGWVMFSPLISRNSGLSVGQSTHENMALYSLPGVWPSSALPE